MYCTEKYLFGQLSVCQNSIVCIWYGKARKERLIFARLAVDRIKSTIEVRAGVKPTI